MSKLKVLEGFSGDGAVRMALRNTGIDHEVVAISEIDKWAIKSYEAIHGQTLNLGDISKINIEDIPDFDMFSYGFPCQDISKNGNMQGLKEGSNTRSSLLWECKKVIETKKPKYLLMENVPMLVSKKFINDFRSWLELLEELGYKCYWKVLKATDYNVPQARERVFCVSVLGEHKPFEFPKPVKLNYKILDLLEIDPGCAEYIEDSPIIERVGNEIRVKQATKKGYDIANVGDSINLEHPKSKTRRGRVGKQVAQTITTQPQQAIVLPDGRIRKLTSLEIWRLMGFSDMDYMKLINAQIPDKQIIKQSGNAIVVQVLESIFRNLFF